VDAVVAGQVRVDACQFCMACVDRCPESNLDVVDTWRREESPRGNPDSAG